MHLNNINLTVFVNHQQPALLQARLAL